MNKAPNMRRAEPACTWVQVALEVDRTKPPSVASGAEFTGDHTDLDRSRCAETAAAKQLRWRPDQAGRLEGSDRLPNSSVGNGRDELSEKRDRARGERPGA